MVKKTFCLEVKYTIHFTFPVSSFNNSVSCTRKAATYMSSLLWVGAVKLSKTFAQTNKHFVYTSWDMESKITGCQVADILILNKPFMKANIKKKINLLSILYTTY
jgi:hypothetical protein